MAMENPFEMVIYDRDMNFTGFVVDPIFLNFVPSWDNQGYGNFSLTANNPHTAALQADGARIVVHYKGRHLMSGPVRSWRGDVSPRGVVTYQMLDDKRILNNVLLYVNPGAPLAPTSLSDPAQGWYLDGDDQTVGSIVHQYSYFHWPDGSSFDDRVITDAESAIKWAVQRNVVDRLGMNVTIMPNQQRGGNVVDVLPKVRMVPLSEVMTPITNASGLGTRLWQDQGGKTINFDVVEPGVWSQPLTLESGIITGGTYSKNAPNITRSMNAGPGTTVARAFRGTQGPTRTPLEAQYGDVIELFNEVNGFAELVWPKVNNAALPTNLQVAKYFPFRGTPNSVAAFEKTFAAGNAASLLGGAPTTGISLQLAETETFHFGGSDGIQLGDFVTCEIQGVQFTDQITEVQMDFTRSNGLVIAPLVGDMTDDPDKTMARKVADLYRAYRTQASIR